MLAGKIVLFRAIAVKIKQLPLNLAVFPLSPSDFPIAASQPPCSLMFKRERAFGYCDSLDGTQ